MTGGIWIKLQLHCCRWDCGPAFDSWLMATKVWRCGNPKWFGCLSIFYDSCASPTMYAGLHHTRCKKKTLLHACCFLVSAAETTPTPWGYLAWATFCKQCCPPCWLTTAYACLAAAQPHRAEQWCTTSISDAPARMLLPATTNSPPAVALVQPRRPALG